MRLSCMRISIFARTYTCKCTRACVRESVRILLFSYSIIMNERIHLKFNLLIISLLTVFFFLFLSRLYISWQYFFSTSLQTLSIMIYTYMCIYLDSLFGKVTNVNLSKQINEAYTQPSIN